MFYCILSSIILVVHCAANNVTTDTTTNKGPTIEEYLSFVKYLLLKASDFKIFPEPLKCTDIDPKKQLIWDFPAQNEGIRICDLCPNLPPSKLLHIAIDTEPMITYAASVSDSSFQISECFVHCMNHNHCVALTFDHKLESCYIYNSTNGNFVANHSRTTIVMNQPIEIIGDWVYSRHSAISSKNASIILRSPSFLDCVNECHTYYNSVTNSHCEVLSYDFKKKSCYLFTEIEEIDFNYEYGTVTAFNIDLIHQNDSSNAWRFVKFEDSSQANKANETHIIRSSNNCVLPKNQEFGNFYTQECLITNALGCDQTFLGCQYCYYPEVSGTLKNNLTICRNSRFIQRSQQKGLSDSCFDDCIHSENCIAVDFNGKEGCSIITIFKWVPPSSKMTRYNLMYPEKQNLFRKFSWNVKSKLVVLSNVAGGGILSKRTNVTLHECLSICLKNLECQKVSYSRQEQECSLANNRIGLITNHSNTGEKITSTTFFRKPALNNNFFHFHRTPGAELASSNYTDQLTLPLSDHKASNNILRKCLTYCLNNLTLSCQYISVKYLIPHNTNVIVCSFFGTNINISTQDNRVIHSINGEIFTRALAKLDLKSMNSVPFFQEEDLKNCFRTNTEQTETTLSNDDENLLFESRLMTLKRTTLRRRKRGWNDFWNGVKNVGKAIGEAVVSVVKDTVNTVVETGKGIVKAVGKVFEGDLGGAVDAVANIPVVKTITETAGNVVKLGKAIIEGDLESAGNAALDIATSKAFDIIPIGRVGRVAATVTKNVIRKTKETTRKVVKKRRQPKRRKPEAETKSRKNNEEKCRISRNAKGKRKRTNSCGGNENCRRPKITNVLSTSIKDCDFVKKGKKCTFECRAGFEEEPGDSKIVCKEEAGKKNKYAFYPTPKCVKSDCDNSSYPVIPVSVTTTVGKRTMYVVKFDKNHKLPLWSVAYIDEMNKDHSFERWSSFTHHPCDTLNNHQAKASNYKNSGWDKGHLTPAEPMRFALKATRLANLYINVAPQHPRTNQVPWKVLEGHVSCYLGRKKSKKNENGGIVVTGICPESIGKTKVKNGIDVPSCFWKMLCYKAEGKVHVVGFIGDNSRTKNSAEEKQRNTQIMTPVSQAEIISKLSTLAALGNTWAVAANRIFHTIDNPWLLAGRYKDSRGMPPVQECIAAKTLEPTEASKWSKVLNEKKKSRKKRQSESTRGCTSSEMKEMANIMGLSSLKLSELEKNPPIIVEDDTDDEDNSVDGINSVVASSCGKRVIGYYPSWGTGRFSAQQASRLTHVVFAFLEMKADGHIVVGSADPTHSKNVDDDAKLALDRLEQLIDVANRFPHLKLMFAVGGWENSQYFSDVAKNPNKRLNFISSTLKIIHTFGFDGIDLDWEYPVTGGAQEGIPADKNNYILLMKELRKVLNKLQEEEGREDRYLISFAGAAGSWTLDPGFDLPGLLQYADWANVMTYDYFGAWESKWGAYTGPPSPLYFAMPPRFSGKTNVHFTMKYYVCRLKNAQQVNMGVPFYGRFWKNVGSLIDESFTMWRKAEQVNGKFEGGFVGWKDIAENYLSNPAFEKHFHDGSKTPYAWNPSEKIFLGYEDTKSLKFKVDYAIEQNLGGLMVWAIDQDDSDYSMLDILANAELCRKQVPKQIFYKCSPLTERRWWIWDEDKKKAGMCGRSAPLYKGYYPLCDPDDPGYSCCGAAGYCGSGPEYCSCPSCKDYASNPASLTDEPIKPTRPIQWYLIDAPDGKRGRCGRDVPKLNGEYAICNPDDENNHCCSNGGYCGNTAGHCLCDGCIDFKQKPDYKFPEKRWWTWGDGADKSGKCGPSAPRINGGIAICDPDSSSAYCCSAGGFCGSTPGHCTCNGCVNFKTNPNHVYKD